MKATAQIKKEIAALGPVSLWGCRKEIRNLHTKMFDDEKIVGMVRAFSQSTIVLLVATDKRLIVMDNFTFYGTDHKDILYMQISGVDYNTRLFFGKIIIEDQTGKNYFDYAYKNDLRRFVKVLWTMVNQYRDKVVNKGEGKKRTNVADEIGKLWQLCQEGALTKGEFDERKKKLLNE